MVSILIATFTGKCLVEADQIRCIAGFVRIYRNDKLFMQISECDVLKVIEEPVIEESTIPIGLLNMTQSDVEDYMNELCGDLNAHSISVAEFESESDIVANAYPTAYWDWIQ